MVKSLVSLLVLLAAAVVQAQQPRIVVRDGSGGLREASYMTLAEQDRMADASREAAMRRQEAERNRLTREWTSADGKFKTTAVFLRTVKGGQVELLKLEPKRSPPILVDLARLSENDQKWVKEEVKRQDAAKKLAKKKAAVAKRR